MSNFYNVFGQFVSTQTIETFVSQDDKIDNTKILNNIKVLKVQIETGAITKEQIITEIEKLNSLKMNKDTSDEVKNAIESLVKNTVSKVDGIRLAGNMELTGIMKSRGFYLTDGTKVNEVTRVVDKLAIPLDKDGHLTILPPKGKKVKATVNELNIPKSGRITFGDKEDNDPYHLRKIGNADNNHLRLSLNDNNNESLQIWGDSCKTDKCAADGGTFKHGLYSDGNAKHTGDIIMNGGNNWIFHTPDDKRHSLYISPSTTLGKEDWKWSNGIAMHSNGEVEIKNSKNTNNPTGWSTHFNHVGKGHNYIRGKTEMRGGVNVLEGRSHFKDAENKGRVRVGAAWGIPGFYSEDNQDIVVGVPSAKKVNLGTNGKFVEIYGNGDMKVPGKICINKTCITEAKLTKLLQSGKSNKKVRYIQLGNTNGATWDKYWSISSVKVADAKGIDIAKGKPARLITGTPLEHQKTLSPPAAITDGNYYTGEWKKYYHAGGKNDRTLLEIDLGADYLLESLSITVSGRNLPNYLYRQKGTHLQTFDSDRISTSYNLFEGNWSRRNLTFNEPIMIGSNTSNKSIKVQNNSISDIMNNHTFEITASIQISSGTFKNGWRNIYHYGNNNDERAPALWMYHNDPWRYHFRIDTNKKQNDGYDFYIPAQLRKANTPLAIKTRITKMAHPDGIKIEHFVNGISAGVHTIANAIFKKYDNRAMYIKDPWHSLDTYLKINSIVIQ